MRAFVGYASLGAAVTFLLAGVLAGWAWPDSAGTIWTVAVLAYTVQLAAFAALQVAGKNQQRFLLAWAGGTVLRLGLLGALAMWLWWSGTEPKAPWLLGLAGMLFPLMLLEPVFLRSWIRES